MVNRLKVFVFLLLTTFAFTSCFKDIGRKISAGVRKEMAKSQIDSLTRVISKSAAKGILEVALSDSVQARLRLQIDSIGKVIDKQVGATSIKLRDSVILNNYTELWVQNVINAAGKNFQTRGLNMLDDIRGDKTRLFVANIRDELLNDVTLQRAAIFRDELLGANTHTLIDSLAQKVARGLINNQINPGSQKLISRINKVAADKIKDARRLTYLAGFVALLIGGVAFFIYRQASRHKKTLKIITNQINKIPDQSAYDYLVKSIRQETQTKGLEPHLQSILKEEKLYQQAEWQNKDMQVLNLVGQYLQELNENKIGQSLMQDLSERAKQVNLQDQLESILARSGSKNVSLQN